MPAWSCLQTGGPTVASNSDNREPFADRGRRPKSGPRPRSSDQDRERLVIVRYHEFAPRCSGPTRSRCRGVPAAERRSPLLRQLDDFRVDLGQSGPPLGPAMLSATCPTAHDRRSDRHGPESGRIDFNPCRYLTPGTRAQNGNHAHNSTPLNNTNWAASNIYPTCVLFPRSMRSFGGLAACSSQGESTRKNRDKPLRGDGREISLPVVTHRASRRALAKVTVARRGWNL